MPSVQKISQNGFILIELTVPSVSIPLPPHIFSQTAISNPPPQPTYPSLILPCTTTFPTTSSPRSPAHLPPSSSRFSLLIYHISHHTTPVDLGCAGSRLRPHPHSGRKDGSARMRYATDVTLSPELRLVAGSVGMQTAGTDD